MSVSMEIAERGQGPGRSKHQLFKSADKESLFHARYDLTGSGLQHIKKVISERYTEEKRKMSLSPTPKKIARLEIGVQLVAASVRHAESPVQFVEPVKQCADKDRRHVSETRSDCSEVIMDTSDTAVHIKSEPPDFVEKEQMKELAAPLYSPPRIRCNSLHSSTRYFPSGGQSDIVHTSASSSVHRGRGRPRRLSISSDHSSTSLSSSKIEEVQTDQPDSSTESCEQLMLESGRRHSVSNMTRSDDHTSSTLPASTSTRGSEAVLCQVCGDLAAGFYCDAYICEACKKFFIRASKLERPRYVCLRQKSCVITKESRVHCQYCRYQKCLQLSMHYSKDGHKNAGGKVGVQEIPCRVCSAPSSGFHFGALTCEGCKGFFRRMVKEREAYSYKCSRSGNCEVNSMTRNMCKACRYHKCLMMGMSVEGSRIGRQPNAVKHAISLEAKKQASLKTEPETESVVSSPPNLNFDSIVLDPLSDDMDESLHSVDTSKGSVSVDASPPLNMVEVKHDQTPQLPGSWERSPSPGEEQKQVTSSWDHITSPSVDQKHTPSSWDHITSPRVDQKHSSSSWDWRMSQVPGQGVSSTVPPPIAIPQQHSDMFRIPSQIVPPLSDQHKLVQSPYPANVSHSSSLPATPFRAATPEHSVQPQTTTPSPSPDNQPQDLTVDLSVPRTLTMSSNNCLSRQNHPPYPPAPPPPHLSPPMPSTTTSSYSIRDYAHQPAHNYHSYFHRNSPDQDNHMPLYQQRGNFVDPAFNTESSNHYISQGCAHVPHQEDYISDLSCPRSHSLEDHFSSQSPPSYNHQQQNFAEHHLPPCSQREAELLQHPQLLMQSKSVQHFAEQHVYSLHAAGGGVTSSSSLPNLQERSLQVSDPTTQLNFKVSPQNWAHTATLPSSTYYHTPQQVHPPSPSVTQQREAARPSPCITPQREAPRPSPSITPQGEAPRPSPASTPSFDLLDAPSPAPIPERIAAFWDQNYMSMSNEKLNAVILEAAKNLAQLCLVQRAKSNRFDAARYQDVDSTWDKMMEHFHFHAKCIVRFAKRVPGFRKLKIDDQVLLLRMSTYSLVILNHSRAYELDTGFYNYFNFSQNEIKRIAELFPEFDVIHSHYKHTGIMVQRLGMTDMELAYLSCILLLNEENPGLEDVDKTKELKGTFLQALQEYEMANFSNGTHRFAEILGRLAEFPQISMQHNIAVGLVITKHSQLHIPQLYAEMYTQNGSDTI